MKLIDLEPTFLRYEEKDGHVFWRRVESLVDAQGIHFLCTKCFQTNKGPVGTHMIGCWFRDRGVPDQATPGPARWVVSGTDFNDLTLAPSVQLVGGCAWHGFVQSGVVT